MDPGTSGEPPIADDAVLWRRVSLTNPDVTTYDENQGRMRPSSAAFSDPPDGSSMSAFVAGEASVEQVLQGHDGYGLATFPIQVVRDLGLTVVRVPAGGPGHVEVVGEKRKAKSAIAKAAQWQVPLT